MPKGVGEDASRPTIGYGERWEMTKGEQSSVVTVLDAGSVLMSRGERERTSPRPLPREGAHFRMHHPIGGFGENFSHFG